MQLQLALHKLNNDTQYDELLFWGKVLGTVKDYYIALAVNYKGKYQFPEKDFYWASSANYAFAKLPDMLQQHAAEIDSITTPFTGEHDLILKDAEGKAPEESGEAAEAEDSKENEPAAAEESDDDVAIKVPKKNLRELDRLGYVVRAIENDTHVVPEGSFRLTPSHEVRRYGGYGGLAGEDLADMGKYYYFRVVQTAEKRAKLEREEAVFMPDFLDSICEDSPQGAWTLHLDASKTKAVVRSLLWPGYVAYHRVKTGSFGGVYVGSGLKNADLPFML